MRKRHVTIALKRCLHLITDNRVHYVLKCPDIIIYSRLFSMYNYNSLRIDNTAYLI